ncbi:GNAT family N-acetyltransferase [Rhodococcus sp. IEGM 1330]|uniref:GNAT family N-acetyltransferase n=1 Tax=Rhodococcus sp. IEGM 1330 TaxID=3082225 RepID=UPI00295527BA|nr:GNAT family N-acetyltransferase [Rhodococcus sp. IEGM 1330]MDV8022821.1 GNAT family N-acetyltransferase [Rhodococcus sp. IEGM 1330]
MTVDKTGAEVEIAQQSDRFTISVEGTRAGFTEFVDDEQGRRIFFHTEVDAAYGGRGLATVLVQRALDSTRDQDKRIVPICELVAAFLGKHSEFDDIIEQPTDEIRQWLADRLG